MTSKSSNIPKELLLAPPWHRLAYRVAGNMIVPLMVSLMLSRRLQGLGGAEFDWLWTPDQLELIARAVVGAILAVVVVSFFQVWFVNKWLERGDHKGPFGWFMYATFAGVSFTASMAAAVLVGL